VTLETPAPAAIPATRAIPATAATPATVVFPAEDSPATIPGSTKNNCAGGTVSLFLACAICQQFQLQAFSIVELPGIEPGTEIMDWDLFIPRPCYLCILAHCTGSTPRPTRSLPACSLAPTCRCADSRVA
jgi:hypothetical protein